MSLIKVSFKQYVQLFAAGTDRTVNSQTEASFVVRASPPLKLQTTLLGWHSPSGLVQLRKRNTDALVKVGDYYYHGLGVPDEPESVRWEKAAKYYQSAANTQLSALAMWNLGWMYENGIGVAQVSDNGHYAWFGKPMLCYIRTTDLAKTYYDQALETNERGLSSQRCCP
jgi:TPR repeat protein